ncbi:acyltransferase [Akkermansiaceae bacterium]|nr:acyltransferase [Akkermansiaceae bacterium]MDC1205946.1 acyltransferase [Akkermansiaceae bacterium]
MKHRDHTLDLVRGLSALLVMLGHLRGFVFFDLGELENPSIATKAFYFATGLGHQAVMVFFVLSGYFVGGSVLSGLAKKRFTWAGYATARLTRLWMVLLPALLLTLAIDLLGQSWNPEAYAGAFKDRFMSGPSSVQPAAHDLVTFFGNMGFLQTVTMPVYGSNGPLWSLANEFWYYVMFPLLIVPLWRMIGSRERTTNSRWGVGGMSLLLFGVIVSWLPKPLVMSSLIWLMGAVVWWCLWKTKGQQSETGVQSGRMQRGKWGWWILGAGLFMGSLVASKTEHWLGSDYVVGITFAIWLLFLPGTWRMPAGLGKLVTGLSEISYTLYVVHFPLLFFVSAVVLKGRQFPADGMGFLWFGGLSAGVLVISILMWWLFERNTGWVRKRVWRF